MLWRLRDSMQLNELLQNLMLQKVDIDCEIAGLNTLVDAKKTDISFFNKQQQAKQLRNTQAAAVFVSPKDAELVPKSSYPLVVSDPYLYLAYASKFFSHSFKPATVAPQIGKDCMVDASVNFGNNVVIGDRVTILGGCYIGDNVTIGSDSLIHANATVYHNCVVGKECIIHSGTVIGSDGYGFATKPDKTHVKIYQNGNVIIEDDVEIGANCTIDRAVFNATVIKKGTKLDNLIHIAHNCIVGKNNFFASQVGLSGSTITGDNVMMGGQAGSAGHLEIAPYSVIAARGGVTKDIKKPGYYAGFPLMEGKAWLKLQAKLSRMLKG
ncbi:MAG: UDP-3-O-(3-hydroxymyristoyl)glucosamine N-acyltransferase [Campylobacterota bacterium]